MHTLLQLVWKNPSRKLLEGMWTANCVKRVAKEVLGYHKECGQPTKETWCWNEEVQTTLRSKRENHKSQLKCRDDECHSFKL